MLLYQQIHEYIVSLIQESPELEKLPSERQLQERFNSTRITVREALMRLEAEGIIYRLNRKGWFVNAARLKWDPIKKVNFYALASDQGFLPDTKVLGIDTSKGPNDIQCAFSAEDDMALYRLIRVRYLDGRPVLYEVIYCRCDDFPELQNKSLAGSLTQIFTDDYGIRVTHERSQIFVSALHAREAAALEQNEGSSCLKIVRKRFDTTDRLIDYNIEYWVHGAIELNVESHELN